MSEHGYSLCRFHDREYATSHLLPTWINFDVQVLASVPSGRWLRIVSRSMISWGVQCKCIQSPTPFFGKTLSSRKPDLQATKCRKVRFMI